jgi:ATP-dependent helicase/nuclease subunit A
MSRGHEFDFTGLELSASRLLRGQAAAGFHERLDQRFRHLLVDEFQDTNPVQWAMLKHWLSQYLQSDSMGNSAPRVFLVGDPKQSIYRFRRADPQVFQLAGDWLVKHFKAIRLQADTTRRCAQPLVDFLNQAAPRLLGHSGSARYRQHSTLSRAPGWVRRLPVAVADAEVSSWTVEGRQIAQALIQLKSDQADLRWSDIRVLTRTRQHMADYEAALRSYGVPFVSDRSGGLLNEPEVKDLIALLRFLAYPWSDRDLAQVLKSPIGGLSDDQLVAIASAFAGPLSTPATPTLWQRLRQHAAQTTDPVIRSLATEIVRWQTWADQLPVHDLLDRIIHQHHLMDRMAARFSGARGLQCLANIEALIALALELDHGRLPSLARFLQELTRWSDAPETESPGLGVLPGADAVSLSSLHSAKGLEARVVVLAGMLDREPMDKGLRWLMHWNEARDRIESAYLWRRSDPLPEGLLRALDDDQRQSQDEDFNLLYVGITRAKEFLLLSAAEGTDDGWYQQISEFCEEWVPAESTTHAPPLQALQWRGLVFPKHAQGQHNSEPPASPMQSPLDPGSRAESLAIRKGKALHRLLEFGPQRSETFGLELLAEFALPRQARSEVMTALQVIRESAVSSIIFSADVLAYAEAEWVTTHGELIRPDRVVRVQESPEEWWIVDFKWQLLDSERAAYASQLSTYQETFQTIRPSAKVLAKILTAGGQVFRLHQGQLVPDVH